MYSLRPKKRIASALDWFFMGRRYYVLYKKEYRKHKYIQQYMSLKYWMIRYSLGEKIKQKIKYL